MTALKLTKVTTEPATGTANLLSFYPNADSTYVDLYITSNDGTQIRHTIRKEDVVALIDDAIAGLVGAAPEALNALNELAAAIGNDENFSTTVTNALATKAPLASPTFTGTPTAPTVSSEDDSTKIATTAFVKSAIASFGSGDMAKTTYDSTNNGIVDNAESVELLDTDW